MKFQVNMLNSLGVMARTKNVDGRTDARTDARTHARTDGRRPLPYPPTPSGGGIINLNRYVLAPQTAYFVHKWHT